MNDENPEKKTPAAPERPAADAEATREAFFAAIPDPPANVVAAPDDDAEEPGDEPAPKAAPAKAAKAAAEGSAPPPVADQILAALKAGDLDLLADLTDQDPAAFDEKSTKWAARNRKEAKLKDEIAKVKADAAAVVDHYEPLDTRLTAFQSTRDYGLVAEIVELLTGEDWDSVGMKVFRAKKAQDPRVPELTKRLAERDAELSESRTAKEKAADRALREALRDDLPEDHVVRKLPEWEERVARVLRDSVDEVTGEPALSFKQAATRVVRKEREEYEKRAAVFGGETPARKAKAETPERAAGATGANKRKLTPDEFFAQYGK